MVEEVAFIGPDPIVEDVGTFLSIDAS